jgi:hypothetical protein
VIDLALLAALAPKLIKFWETGFPAIWSDKKITKDDLVVALKFLVDAELLDGTKLGTLLAAGESAVPLVTAAIEAFQRRGGVNAGQGVGILTTVTRNAMKGFRTCGKRPDEKQPLPPGSRAATENRNRNTNVIFYWLEPQLVSGRLDGEPIPDLVADAWQLWQQHAPIKVLDVIDRADANVIVEMKGIDKAGNTLGMAHVGGRRIDAVLVCTMDADEHWTASKFRAATCHEFGHILGLTHSRRDDQLMSPLLPADLARAVPQEEDIQRIQVEWGLARRPGSGATSPSTGFMERIGAARPT